MTAPKPAETDPLAQQKARLLRAAWDVKKVLPETLSAAIERMHADEHDGPMRWCKHPVCTEAQLAGDA